jgi:hypothetical protein
MKLSEYIKSKKDFLFPIYRSLFVAALVAGVVLAVSIIEPPVGVYFHAQLINLPRNSFNGSQSNSEDVENVQLLIVKVRKNKQEQVDIDNIIISPCISVNSISSIKPQNIIISNDDFSIVNSENIRTGKELHFKGLKAIPAGESELSLFFWGVFDFPEIISVNISSPNLGLIEGKRMGYFTGIKWFVSRYISWISLLVLLLFLSVFFYYRSLANK